MITVVRSPQVEDESGKMKQRIKIFLAGSIEMGKAEPWQQQVIDKLSNTFSKAKAEIVLYDPRRDEWDSSWEQSITNPKFNEQVTWELEHLEKSDIVIFYFDPNTKSPITLMELGLMVGGPSNSYGMRHIIVCCPNGFWRKGNVDIVCDRYGIPVYNNKPDFIQELIAHISNDIL